MRIAKVYPRPAYESYTFSSIFGSLYRGHSAIKYLTRNPTKEVSDGIALPPGYPRHVATLLSAVQHTWRLRVTELQALDRMLSTDRAVRMCRCGMPLLAYDSGPGMQVHCHNYAICPFCRFRTYGLAGSRMLTYLPDFEYVAALPIILSPESGCITQKDVLRVKALLDKLYGKKWNYWDCDIVITIPRIKRGRGRKWVVTAGIVALSNDRKAFWSPRDRLGIGSKWDIRPATPHHLSALLAKLGEYSAPLLYDSAVKDLACIRQAFHGDNGTTCRIRTHGIKLEEEKSKDNKESNYIECKKLRIHGRSTSTPADLAEPYWDSRRRIPSLTADYRVLLDQ